jgi:hypothetical protein
MVETVSGVYRTWPEAARLVAERYGISLEEAVDKVAEGARNRVAIATDNGPDHGLVPCDPNSSAFDGFNYQTGKYRRLVTESVPGERPRHFERDLDLPVVKIRIRALFEYLEEAGMKPVANPTDARTRGAKQRRFAGGRPGKHQWGHIMTEGAGWIWERGFPKTQAKLEQYLLEWALQEFGRHPDESEMTKSVSRLVARLKEANAKRPR